MGRDKKASSAEAFSRVGAGPAWMSKDGDFGNDDADDALHDWRDAHKRGSIYSNGFPVRAVMNIGFLIFLG